MFGKELKSLWHTWPGEMMSHETQQVASRALLRVPASRMHQGPRLFPLHVGPEFQDQPVDPTQRFISAGRREAAGGQHVVLWPAGTMVGEGGREPQLQGSWL